MFCGKCGKQVPDGYEFCMHCGAKIEADQSESDPLPVAPKKRFSKKFTLVPLFGLLAVLIAVGVGFGVTHLLQPKFPYAAMNVNNSAQLACNDSTLVFIDKFDSSDKKSVLLKSHANGSNKKILLDDEDISAVFLYENVVYYKRQANDLITIGKIGLDGNDNGTIHEIPRKDNTISNMVIHDNVVYYLFNSKLCSMDLNGKNQKELNTDKVNSFCIDKNAIYFSTDDYIKKYTISSGKAEDIAKTAAKSLCVYDGYLYFQKPLGAMKRLKMSNNSVESLGGKSVRNYILDKDKMYFIEELSDKEVETYASLVTDSQKEEDILWAKIALIGTGKLYSMNLDGTKIAEVDTDTLLMSCLYNTPKQKYTKISFLSDGLDELVIKE